MGLVKKILVISFFPTHPQNAGSKKRSYNFLLILKKLGHEIHFIYENREFTDRIFQRPNFKAMRKEWDSVYVLPLGYYELKRYFDRKVGQLGILIRKTTPVLFNIFKKAKNKIKPLKIDSFYNPALDKFIQQLLKKTVFDVVLIQSVFLSKALGNFDSQTLKIIDTIDALTSQDAYNRNKYASHPIYENEEESKAIDRADIIIALQDKEKEFFETMTDKKVVTIGHFVELRKPLIRSFNRRNILFIGFDNSANKHGINFFIQKVFPKVKDKFSDAKLLVAGRVCNFVPTRDGIIKLGEIKNINEAYDLADLVICPLFFGTGLKIKAIEALAYCKPLVSTSHGAIGLEREKAFLIANTVEEFVQAIDKVLSDKELYEQLSKSAHEFIKEYNEKNIKALKEIF